MRQDERLARLEKKQREIVDRLNLYAEQLAEQNLRVRFIMHAIELRRPIKGGLVDQDGNAQTEASDLFVQYMDGGRDQLLAKLEEEQQVMLQLVKQMQEEGGTVSGEGTPDGDGEAEAAAAGGEPGAEPPGSGGAADDAPAPQRRSFLNFRRQAEGTGHSN